MPKITRALISVSDKTGIEEFAKGLNEFGVEILSTGGTAKRLKELGIPVRSVSDYTGFPEMLDGRVKTLHPKIHGALLAIRDNKEHMEQVKKHNIELIDMVVVNLYPFEKTISKPAVKLEEAIENIDIGGPTMLRSASKNYKNVAVICNPAKYSAILKEMKQNDGKVNENTCAVLAYEVFDHTSKYDTMISRYLATKFLSEDEKKSAEFPDKLEIMLEKIQDLRYGENSHQQAAFYRKLNGSSNGLAKLKQLHGKELSFNNIIDLEAAWKVSLDFNEPVSVIIKHTNPCGVATGQDLYSAFKLSLESDPVSAFGGIIGFNREVDDKTAVEVSKLFVEAVVAPGFSEKAIEVLKQKPSIRLIVLDKESHKKGEYDYKRVSGGMLLQNNDDELFGGELKTVTKKQPSGDELEALKFAWKVCKHVKSNAIVYAIKGQTIGIGAGQTSRVDSSELAIAKSKKNKLQIKGTVMASDAFFPFRDAVDAAAEAGVTAIIQPGGSNRDDEVIGACNEHGIAMVFTGMRHFKH